MAQWERKHAGAIVQAAMAHMDRAKNLGRHTHLEVIVQFGKAAEQSNFTDASTLRALRAALCTYCTNERTYPCTGYVKENGCAFVESEVTLTPSCFGDFA
jgi:hypothetical protein